MDRRYEKCIQILVEEIKGNDCMKEPGIDWSLYSNGS
jgi:hypothetical protein